MGHIDSAGAQDGPRPYSGRARAQLLRAAHEVMREAGMHSWSMGAVADRAHVSRRTLYRYFATRDDLVEAVSSLGGGHDRGADKAQGRSTAGTHAVTRATILGAARELFGQRGYDGTTIREVAERAGVSKVVIYHQFKSKSDLFREATLEPLKNFIEEFAEGWQVRPCPRSNGWMLGEIHGFYTRLFDILQGQRDLLLPLLFADPAHHSIVGTSGAQYVKRAFIEWFDRMDKIMEDETAGPEFRAFDRALLCRFVFALALSAALHGDWLFSNMRVSRQHLITELANLTMFGMLNDNAPRKILGSESLG